MKNLIYFTIFGNKKYLNLMNLLMASLKAFGNPNKNIDFLIITSPDFKETEKIFNELDYNIDFHYIDTNNNLYSLSSRLLIFNYNRISEYNKILYLDTDILITNDINTIFNLNLENKLYALLEGTIEDEWHGREFFDFSIINNSTTSFTSGILLFNNCNEINNLFNIIINAININLNTNGVKPYAYDQAFINYYAITNNLYNNTLLTNYCINHYFINNPSMNEYKNHIISHFPGVVGWYENKYDKMSNYIIYIYDLYPFNRNKYNFVINKKFNWKNDCYNKNGYIYFKENNIIETTWGYGTYEILDNNSLKAFWCGDCHLLKFNENNCSFVSIRRGDYHVSTGNYEEIDNYIHYDMNKQRKYKDINYSIFNPNIYKNLYDDLKHMTDDEALQHYITYGIYEKRRFNEKEDSIFNSKIYKNLYDDLKHISDDEAHQHYIKYGIYEKRIIQ